MIKKKNLILIFSILIISLFHSTPLTLEKDNNWDFQNTFFIYDLKINQILPSNVTIKSDLKLTLNFFKVNNNESKFTLTVNGNLATNKITETVSGLENINSRIVNVNLTNHSDLESLLYNYNFQNTDFYSPFNIPKVNYTGGELLKIGFVDYTYINSSSTSFLSKKYDLNNFRYSTETTDNTISYEENYGFVMYSQFSINLTDYDITGNIELLSTNVFSRGTVPLKNYYIAGMIMIIFPGISIFFMLYKKVRNKSKE